MSWGERDLTSQYRRWAKLVGQKIVDPQLLTWGNDYDAFAAILRRNKLRNFESGCTLSPEEKRETGELINGFTAYIEAMSVRNVLVDAFRWSHGQLENMIENDTARLMDSTNAHTSANNLKRALRQAVVLRNIHQEVDFFSLAFVAYNFCLRTHAAMTGLKIHVMQNAQHQLAEVGFLCGKWEEIFQDIKSAYHQYEQNYIQKVIGDQVEITCHKALLEATARNELLSVLDTMDETMRTVWIPRFSIYNDEEITAAASDVQQALYRVHRADTADMHTFREAVELVLTYLSILLQDTKQEDRDAFNHFACTLENSWYEYLESIKVDETIFGAPKHSFSPRRKQVKRGIQ